MEKVQSMQQIIHTSNCLLISAVTRGSVYSHQLRSVFVDYGAKSQPVPERARHVLDLHTGVTGAGATAPLLQDPRRCHLSRRDVNMARSQVRCPTELGRFGGNRKRASHRRAKQHFLCEIPATKYVKKTQQQQEGRKEVVFTTFALFSRIKKHTHARAERLHIVWLFLATEESDGSSLTCLSLFFPPQKLLSA